MTLARSLLLGSAACLAGAAGGQAADLPTRKLAPAEYVKVCNVDGMAGFVLPGANVCFKIGGLLSAQIEAGNTRRGYYWSSLAGQGASLTSTTGSRNPSFGWTTRSEVDLDAREPTSYGVLRGYAAIRFENGSGFDSDGGSATIDVAYVQWAGVTAGKASSFFSFFGGGDTWAPFFSPDQFEQGSNEPDLIAYTATLGGGFSATISAQSPQSNGASGIGTNLNVSNYTPFGTPATISNTTNFGMAAPDIAANVRVDGNWGSAQLSGVAHQVHVYDAAGNSLDIWGWGALAGVTVNLPALGDTDKLSIDAVYTRNAIWYSGISDAMWGENGAVNGNSLAMSVGDAYSAGGGHWATPTAWSSALLFEHHFSAAFSVDPELAYAQLNWSGSMGQLASNSQSWIAGAVGHWDPAPLVDLAVELMYQNTHQSTPGLYTAAVGTIDGKPASFPNAADGFAGRLYLTRNF
jgi:hypothetical protein